MDKDSVIKEYEVLRSEINQKIELHNSLITFMITTVIAILAFALESDNTLLYLLPYGVIIPISMRVTYYRTAMVKLSSYISVYLEKDVEGLNWETRNIKLMRKEILRKNKRKRCYDFFTISHYYEGMILSIICYILYLVRLLKDKTINFNTMDFNIIIYMFSPLSLILWEYVITKRIKSFDKEKEDWIDKWRCLKSKK